LDAHRDCSPCIALKNQGQSAWLSGEVSPGTATISSLTILHQAYQVQGNWSLRIRLQRLRKSGLLDECAPEITTGKDERASLSVKNFGAIKEAQIL
jgi:hypothetical protein